MRAKLSRPVLLAFAGLLVFASVAMAIVGLQNPSFEDGLSSWTSQTTRDKAYNSRELVYDAPNCDNKASVCLIEGSDTFTIRKDVYDESTGQENAVDQEISVTPNDGTKMVRLGGPFLTADEDQEPGLKAAVSQTFTVDSANPILKLNFNVFTWDYSGFDDLEFLVTLTDAEGERITQFNQGSFGPGGDVSFKTTGWQPAYVDLAGYGGEQVHLRISAGGTSDYLYPFWAYIDAGEVAERPVGQPVVDPPQNPKTGEPVPVSGQTDGSGKTYYLIPQTGGVFDFPAGSDQGEDFVHCMDLPISVPIKAGEGGTVSNVQLLLNQSNGAVRQFAMTGPTGPAGNLWSTTIKCVATGDLFVSYTLSEGGESQDFLIPLGGLVLIDPAGVVYDKAAFDSAMAGGQTAAQARATAAIEGASVRLQRETDDGFKNVLSGDPGISPNVNPEITGTDGQYAWDVSAGTYRVLVTKDGYNQAIGGPVTVPPEVTDLHVAMTASGGSGDDGGTGGGGSGGAGSGGSAPGGDGSGGGSPGGSPGAGGPGADGDGTGSGTGTTNPSSGPKKGGCKGLTGRRLAACRVGQQVAKKCGKVRGPKKKVCAKRVRAFAKCQTLKAKTRKQKSKKAACLKKAKAIGQKRKGTTKRKRK